ncbi:MAG: RluA family pseudouridine synthase [Bacteroidales bacterium]|nr:RluA family pseudouridine synthase [Bacteroidales bacterium]HOY38466.1 RluA family pseudouridine synthase [Bacteroidales bacterium]HQN93573.1 RluA family pseudouridine synthase [Prolixibacteraceae bacterium]
MSEDSTSLSNQEDYKNQEELFEHYRFIVDNGQSPVRIDKYLASKIANVSRNKIQAASDAGNIRVNDTPIKSNYKVKPADVITILLSFPKIEFELIAEDIPIEVVYEDNDVLVVNKRAGMVVHPSLGHYQGTLVNALAFHLQGNELFSENNMRSGLVHRIDKDTSGLLVIGKNERALNHLGKQFFEHTARRTYHALVWGNTAEEKGTITGHIGRHLKDRKIMDVFEDGSYGKHAVTHYQVLDRFGYVTYIECKLETGRTHQIRAHFSHIGHPLFNDSDYGGNQILKGPIFNKYKQFVSNCFEICPRQALHAKTLGFIHPVTKKEMMFDSLIPKDMQACIDKWRSYSGSFSV